MASIDDLWRQICENPDDIGFRLVLADALIENGEPRGELIALQCRGADASMLVGGESPTEDNIAERVSELIAANWDTWLGDAARVIVRQGSTFQDGMLAIVQVGGEHPAAFGKLAAHREFCAVKRVRPYKIRSDRYGEFLAGLTRDPAFVEVHSPGVLRAVRALRKQWGIRGVRVGGIGWWTQDAQKPGSLRAELHALAEMAQELETIELPPTFNAAEELANTIIEMPRLFPKLKKVKLEETHNGWMRGAEERLRALPMVEMT